MGLFRRKKKRETQSTSKPKDGNLDIEYGNMKYNTRQNDSGSSNISDANPIMPKETGGVLDAILSEEKIIQTANKARSLIDGGKYQEALEFCEKIISTNFLGRSDSDNLDIWLQKSSAYFNLKRYEESNECEDVILRLISEKGMNPSQRALSLHTKANCYYFLNRLTESKKCLLEVLEFDPYNEEALTDLHDTEMKIAVKERTEKNNTSSQESESIFCENCGKPLKPTAKFCGKCGTPRA